MQNVILHKRFLLHIFTLILTYVFILVTFTFVYQRITGFFLFMSFECLMLMVVILHNPRERKLDFRLGIFSISIDCRFTDYIFRHDVCYNDTNLH